MPFSVKVVLTIVFQNLKTICPKKILFLRKWLKWLIFSSFLQKSAEPDFFSEIGLSQFRATIVKKLRAKNNENR